MSIFVFRVADNATLADLGRSQRINSFRWLTHPELVEQVCLRCLWYHDTVWLEGDPNAPEPPLHDYCACTAEPEFEAGSILGVDPDGREILASDAPVLQPGQYLEKRLARLSNDGLAAALGKGVGMMYRSGLVTARELVTRTDGIRTLGSLSRSLGISRATMMDIVREGSSQKLLETAEKSIGLRKLRLKQRRHREFHAQAMRVKAAPVGRINPANYVVSA